MNRRQQERKRQRAFTQAEANFRHMLREGEPVAFEQAADSIETFDGFDRRAFGRIPAMMHRNGEIMPAGFRASEKVGHHNGIKRLWMLASANKKGAAE